MSVISTVFQNKKLLIIGVLFLALLGTWLMSLQSQEPTTKQEDTAPKLSARDQKIADDIDKKKQADLEGMFNSIANAYGAQRADFPPATAEGWRTVLDNVAVNEHFYDENTGSIYLFTDKTPDFGQVEYKPGYICDKDKETLLKGQNMRVLALRVKLFSGVSCVGSLEQPIN